MKIENILSLVMDEVARAEEIHPYWPSDDIHAAAIVAEESGELVKAVLDATEKKAGEDEIIAEAVQTAASAIRFLKNHINKT